MNNTMPENKKATAPIPAVAAAGEQSIINETTNIIPEKAGERNLRKGSLDTLSMSALYDTAYPPKSVIIENLLYAGTYLFAGAPKIGKSFFMAQLSYHIATGTPLWAYAVHPGEVLYLALEDDYARIQKRLFKMFGMEGTDALHFATQSRTLSGGLSDQLDLFMQEHPNTKLIIVDSASKTLAFPIASVTMGKISRTVPCLSFYARSRKLFAASHCNVRFTQVET